MKKLIIVMFATWVMFTLSSVSAQDSKPISVGLKGGLNVVKISFDDPEESEPPDFKSKTGICFGGFINCKINDKFAIQPEVLYSMKGSKADAEEEGVNANIKVNLNYLEIPVLAQLLIPTEGNFKPNIFVGPYLGIRLSAKTKVEMQGVSTEEDIKDDVKSTDFGLVFGGGVDFNIGQGKFLIDARYNLGLTNIDNEPGSTATVKNRALTIMVGYAFKR